MWVLTQMRVMLGAQALERLEAKLDELSSHAEQQKYGLKGAAREYRLPH